MSFLELYNQAIQEYCDGRLEISTGIHRTRLSKIKNGRLKIRFEELRKIADVLKWPDEVRKQLFDAFLFEKIGKDKYQNRKIAKLFLEELSVDFDENYRKLNCFDLKIDMNFNLPKDTVTISGSASVDAAVTRLLEFAFSNNAKIEIIASPTYERLFSNLYSILSRNTNIAIEHIMTLKMSNETSEPFSYNMNVAKMIYPLFMLNKNYCAYYLYDYSDFSSLMPFYIITDDLSINISKDLMSAIVSQDKEIVDLHKKLFQKQKENSFRLIHQIETPEQYLRYYTKLLTNVTLLENKKLFYSVDYEPCIMPFLDIRELSGVLKNHSASEELIYLSKNYLNNLHKMFKDEMQLSFFTKTGLNSFIATGRISEIPECFGVELTTDMRKKSLTALLNYMKSENRNNTKTKEYRLIDDSKLSIPYGFRFLGCGSCDDHLFFLSNSKDKLPSIFALSNKEILSSVFDFVESLTETDLVYSVEQTIEYLESSISNL